MCAKLVPKPPLGTEAPQVGWEEWLGEEQGLWFSELPTLRTLLPWLTWASDVLVSLSLQSSNPPTPLHFFFLSFVQTCSSLEKASSFRWGSGWGYPCK